MVPEDEGQENLEEEVAVEEGEDYGDRGEVDLSFLQEKKPSVAEKITPKVSVAAERAGVATRRLLEGVGSRLETPSPPDDGLSDLFERPDMERDNDVYIKDLVSMDEEDVFGEGGADMSDILEVDEEDVMGEEDHLGQDNEERRPRPQARHPSQRAIPLPRITGVR